MQHSWHYATAQCFPNKNRYYLQQQILQHKFEPELQKDLYILEYGNILDVALYDIRNHGTLRPLSYFRLQLIIANLKDHYEIEMPPLPFEPKK